MKAGNKQRNHNTTKRILVTPRFALATRIQRLPRARLTHESPHHALVNRTRGPTLLCRHAILLPLT
jgi:hypothetical protein